MSAASAAALTLAGCSRPDAPTPAAASLTAPPSEPQPPPRPKWLELSGDLRQAGTLSAALQGHGLSSAQVHALVEALRGLYDFRDARPAANWLLRLHPDDRKVHYFRFQNGPLEVYEVEQSETGLEGRRAEVPQRSELAELALRIEDSLYQALDDAGESPELATLLADVFAWDIDFYRDQQPGDMLRLVVERRYAADAFIGYGRVLAAEYAGQIGTLRTFWFPEGGDDGQGDYYLEDGRSARKFFLATPLQYRRVSSGFSYKRRHPILGYTRAHLGVDYAAPRGTPVRAMASGRVTLAGRAGASGNIVSIHHGRSLQSSYAHLHRIAPGIRRGVRVKQKQVIGYVGSTGRATGPHLHFSVKRNGRHVNPQKLKLERMDPVPPGKRSAFDQLVSEMVMRLDAIEPAATPPPLVAQGEPAPLEPAATP